jgi:4-amino-4-deoxy-L-arabinose transferase-like glycosyltransferase
LRTYQLDRLPPGLYPDEAMNGNNAFEAIATGNYKLYYPENNGREGLFINIQAQLLRVLVPLYSGLPEPWMLRLASAIFGSLTVLGMYFLGRELFSRRVGLIASFLLATSFWHIMFSRIGFRAIMAPFALVWGFALLLVAIRKGREGKTPNSSLFALCAGAVYGAGFHSYIAYRVSPLLLLLVIPFFHKMQNFWKVAGAFVFAAFLAAAPIGWYYLQNPADFLGRTSQVSVFSSPEPLKILGVNILKTVGMFFVAGDFNERHNLSGSPQLFLPVAILFALGINLAVHGLFHKKPAVQVQKQANPQEQGVKINPLTLGRSSAAESISFLGESFPNKKFGYLACFLWFLLAALPVVISNEGLPHALRAILMIPPVMLLAAVGASWVYDEVRGVRLEVREKLLPAIVGLTVAVLLAQAYRQYFVAWARHPDTPGAFAANYVDVGRAIRELPPGASVYVHVDAGGVDVRGIPMPSQTVMFLTDTFTPDKQQAKNIHYVVPGDGTVIPENSLEYYVR